MIKGGNFLPFLLCNLANQSHEIEWLTILKMRLSLLSSLKILFTDKGFNDVPLSEEKSRDFKTSKERPNKQLKFKLIRADIASYIT